MYVLVLLNVKIAPSLQYVFNFRPSSSVLDIVVLNHWNATYSVLLVSSEFCEGYCDFELYVYAVPLYDFARIPISGS